MKFPNCRRSVLLLLPAVLAACGGVAPDPSPIVNGLTCAFANCTDSATLGVDEISPKFTIAQTDGEMQVTVEGSLGKSANAITTVVLSPDERLSASADGGPEVPLASPDGQGLRHTATLPVASAQPVVRIAFIRGGVRHVSEATMPPRLSVLQPTGQATLSRTAPDLPVRLDLSTTRDSSAMATGTCSRVDGSSFKVNQVSLKEIAETAVAGGYRLNGEAVDAALNDASRRANSDLATTPLVSRCQLTVGWLRSSWGTTAATMNRHGTLRADRWGTHTLSYDGQR